MAEIRLTNTRTRKKELFQPLNPRDVRMYVCGPTVYDRAHLGNARPVLVFDVLFRLLRHAAKENGWGKVTYVRNFTDVDDRINETARKRKEAGAEGTLEELIRARSNETIGWYHEDMGALGALPPTHEPRATEYIAQMVAMIAALIEKGHAYEAEGHVLFAVDTWKAEYGKLSGRSVDDMIAGARVEVAPYKRNPMDFVLWKPSDDDLPGWDSPWGRGRPGWHIECSAMSHALLGESFDIHGGGNDLLFPHHENEIAQSKCLGHDFARVWMHNEMLQVEGKKMSKSLGNFFTVRDLLDQGVPGEVIRFVMLSTHYSKPMDWTERKRREAERRLSIWRRLTEREKLGRVDPEIIAAVADDLNTSKAISILDRLAKDGKLGDLKSSARFLGLLERNLSDWDWTKRSEASVKALQTNALKNLREEKLDYFVARDRFNAIFKSHDLLLDASIVARPFVESGTFKKLRRLDQELQSTLRGFSEFDFQRALEEAKAWKALGKRRPNIMLLAANDVEKDLEVFQKAGEARIDTLALKLEAAREQGRFYWADKLRRRAEAAGFELQVTKDGVRWRPVRK